MADNVRLIGERALNDKLRNLGTALAPDSIAAKAAYHKVGMLLVSQMKLNVRSYKMIHKGHLINSIGYRFVRGGVEVGSMSASGAVDSKGAVPYARLMEFGGKYTTQMFYAMFKRVSEDGSEGKNKGILVNGKLKARPYVFPALEKHRENIARIFVDEITEGMK